MMIVRASFVGSATLNLIMNLPFLNTEWSVGDECPLCNSSSMTEN